MHVCDCCAIRGQEKFSSAETSASRLSPAGIGVNRYDLPGGGSKNKTKKTP